MIESIDHFVITVADLEATLSFIDEVQLHVENCGVAIELGPVERVGARGAMTSIYFRDPDGNLIEVSRYPLAPRGSRPG